MAFTPERVRTQLSDERPDALLRSALEKIVYFEARSGQLSQELKAAREEADRLRAELASAGQREIELRREQASYEVRLGRAHAEREELAKLHEALKRERAALMGRILEASRIHEAGREELDSGFDLASFIAELRSEALRAPPDMASARMLGGFGRIEAQGQGASNGSSNGSSNGAYASCQAANGSAQGHGSSQSARGSSQSAAGASLQSSASAQNGQNAGLDASRAQGASAQAALVSAVSSTSVSSGASVEVAVEQPEFAFAMVGAGVRSMPQAMNVAPPMSSQDVRAALQEAVSSSKPPESPAPAGGFFARSSTYSSVTQHAVRFRGEGRLGVNAMDMQELAAGTRFAGRSEETLFGFSVRELSAPDPTARLRAAERLRSLGEAAATPALVTALNAEEEPRVQVALLAALADLGTPASVEMVTAKLSSASPEVRIASLKALLTLDPTQAGPHLSAAVKDPDPAVRRRASLLALSLPAEAALKLSEVAMRDTDAEVRRLAALALGASSGEAARSRLLELMRDREREVRHAAAQSLSRILGEDVLPVVSMDETQRRRELRRLATLPVRPVRASAPIQLPAAPKAERAPSLEVTRQETAAAWRPAAPAAAASRPAAPAAVASRPAASAAAAPRPAASAAAASRPAAPAAAAPRAAQPEPRTGPSIEPLCGQILTELRVSIRGRMIDDLSRSTGEPADRVEEACALLAARGTATRRGVKYFIA